MTNTFAEPLLNDQPMEKFEAQTLLRKVYSKIYEDPEVRAELRKDREERERLAAERRAAAEEFERTSEQRLEAFWSETLGLPQFAPSQRTPAPQLALRSRLDYERKRLLTLTPAEA